MPPTGWDALLQIYVRFFFLLTPFWVVSTFLALTPGMDTRARHRLAVKVIGASVVLAYGLLFFGNTLFAALGITVDAFRLGAGVLLMLSGIDLVRGGRADAATPNQGDIAVVPLAIPVTIGPATIGGLLIMGADATAGGGLWPVSLGLLGALLTIGGILLTATGLEKILGRRGLTILSKITGLMLAAMSADFIVTGAAQLWQQSVALP